jgi:phage repressor protein C with HTH and peptisase S24 domain
VELDPVRLRVMQLIQNSSTDLKNASLALGRNAAYLHQYVYRGTPKVLPEDVRVPLAALLGVADEELRQQEPVLRRVKVAADDDKAEERPRRRSSYAEGFSPVSEIDVRASAGAGALNDGLEEAKGVWLFPDPMIRHEFRTKADHLRLITIDGDSMEPLLSSGDRILIDTSQRVPVPPGIFVIWDGMGVVAKRVEHIPHSDPPKVVIQSVNPAYQTYEREAEEVSVIGRVIWLARRL